MAELAAAKKRLVKEAVKCQGTAERVAGVATSLFASQGFDGTSTKEICELAGVNVAAIHYHFGSKEDLYRHIIGNFGDTWLGAVTRILEIPANREDLNVRLQLFVMEYLDMFVRQPDLCRIVQTEIELLHARSADVFRNTFLKAFDLLVEFFSQAKRKKLMRKDLDPEVTARALFSQLSHQTRTDKVNERFYGVTLRDELYRKRWIQQTLRIFTNGISA